MYNYHVQFLALRRCSGEQSSESNVQLPFTMYNLPFPFEQLDIRVLIAPAKLYIVHGKLYIMNYAFPSSQAVILSLF